MENNTLSREKFWSWIYFSPIPYVIAFQHRYRLKCFLLSCTLWKRGEGSFGYIWGPFLSNQWEHWELNEGRLAVNVVPSLQGGTFGMVHSSLWEKQFGVEPVYIIKNTLSTVAIVAAGGGVHWHLQTVWTGGRKLRMLCSVQITSSKNIWVIFRTDFWKDNEIFSNVVYWFAL